MSKPTAAALKRKPQAIIMLAATIRSPSVIRLFEFEGFENSGSRAAYWTKLVKWTVADCAANNDVVHYLFGIDDTSTMHVASSVAIKPVATDDEVVATTLARFLADTSEMVVQPARATTNVSLLTYNPARWSWEDRDELLAEIADTGNTDEAVDFTWSVGQRTSGIGPGDEVYLLRQGPDPRGIIAYGEVHSEIQQDEHWNGNGGFANYVEVAWKQAVAADDPLPVGVLKVAAPGQHWHPQGSGSQLRPEYVAAVETLWAAHVGR